MDLLGGRERMQDLEVKIHKRDRNTYQITVLDCPDERRRGASFTLATDRISQALENWQRMPFVNNTHKIDEDNRVKHGYRPWKFVFN